MSAEEEELQQLRETIAELEKFHQAMPEDRQTLEILAVAYGKVGDAAGQVRALGDLAGVLVRQKDWEHARIIAENLRSFKDDPAAQAAADIPTAIMAHRHLIDVPQVYQDFRARASCRAIRP